MNLIPDLGVNLNGSIVGVITGDYSIQTFVRKSYKFKGMKSWWIGIITICIHCLGILTICSRSTSGWLILRLRFTKVLAFFWFLKIRWTLCSNVSNYFFFHKNFALSIFQKDSFIPRNQITHSGSDIVLDLYLESLICVTHYLIFKIISNSFMTFTWKLHKMQTHPYI